MEYELKKLKEYLGEELYQILKERECFIAGGFIRNLFTNSEINDIDIYFRSKSQLEKLLCNEFNGKHVLCATKKAITFQYESKQLQFIHINYFDNATQIFDSFDFTCCMGAFDFKNEEFILHKDFLKHNAQRILKFNSKTLFPIVSALRINKYVEKGYNISRKTFIEIMLSINNLQINNLEELKEQLGGMYGENVGDIFSEELKENFSVDKALKELVEKEFIYQESETIDFDNYNLFVKELLDDKIKYFEYKEKNYVKLGSNLVEVKELKNNYVKCDMEEIIKFPIIKYKIVKKSNDKYLSYQDNNYEYFIGKESKPKNDYYGLYVLEKEEIESHYFYKNEDKTILKCLIESLEDFYDITNQERVKKLFVMEEVEIHE